MTKFLILTMMTASVVSAEPVVEGQVKLERSTCTVTSSGQTCGDYQILASKPFSVAGDNGKAEYVRFDLGGDQVAQVKVGTNGGGDFFLTTGLYAHDSTKRFAETGDTIFQIDKKDGLRSVQIYSPSYDDNGTMRDLKATILFTNFSK